MNGHGLNLFKPRTRFGRFLDDNNLSQQNITNISGINRTTMSSLCNDKNYNPFDATKIKIIGILRRNGYDVSVGDFW